MAGLTKGNFVGVNDIGIVAKKVVRRGQIWGLEHCFGSDKWCREKVNKRGREEKVRGA